LYSLEGLKVGCFDLKVKLYGFFFSSIKLI